MSVNLSLAGGAAAQFFTNTGAVLTGGKLYTYAAGTTTPAATYTTNTGLVAHTNPIVLDAAGRVPSGEIWLTDTVAYKFVLKTSTDVTIATYDNITGNSSGIYAALAAPSGSSLVGFIQSGTGAVATTVQTKLRESVSVKDFGAVGDGVTNDTAAIQLALAASSQVTFPAGSYLVSTATFGANALEFSAGASLTIPNGVTLTFNDTELVVGLQKIFTTSGTGIVKGTILNSLILPEWWGAIADGLHPPVGVDFSARATAAARNAPALQAALDFAGDQYSFNGLAGTVSLTYGYYVYDTTLSIPLSTNLIGYGIGSALFYYAATGNAVEMISTNNTLVSDIFIAPIAGPTWNFTTGRGLYLDGVSTPIVRNVWCSQFGSGDFYIKSAIEGRFYGLVSDNANGGSFDISGVGQGSVFQNCVTAGTENGKCFNIHDGYDWILIGCVGKDASTGTGAFYLNACENINLIACGCHDVQQNGFELTGTALNCNLTDCFVNECGAAAANTYNGFEIRGTNNKLTSCKVTANTVNYKYALLYGGDSTDCSSVNHNLKSGLSGVVFDGQPIGSNVYSVTRVSTSNATPLNIWAKNFNNNAVSVLEAIVVARQFAGEIATYKFWAFVKTDSGGTVFSAGPTSLYSYESSASLNATFVMTDATGNAGLVSLQVTGLATGQPVYWEAVVNVTSVTN